MYLYFESKAELLAGLQGAVLRGVRGHAGRPAGRGAGRRHRGAGRAAGGRLLRLRAGQPRPHHVLFHEAGPGRRTPSPAPGPCWRSWSRPGRAAGELDVADPALATDFLLLGLHGGAGRGDPPARVPSGGGWSRG